MTHRSIARLLSAWALAALLAACGAGSAAAPTVAPPAAPTVAPTAAPTSAPAATLAPTAAAAPSATALPASAVAATPAGLAALTDSAGRQISLAGVPQRLVSLAPSTTELAYALDLGPQLLAVDDFSNYPAAAADLPKIGGSNGAYNFEQIVALKPDVVLAAGITAPDAIQKLDDLDVPVVVIGSPETTFDSIVSDIRLLGAIGGHAEKAEQIVTDMQARLEAVKAAVATADTQPKVFWELDATDPAKPYTVGPGNFVDEIVTLAGGQNIFASASTPFPQVSAEQVIAADPDVIVLADANYGMTAEMVGARPGWGEIAAVQAGRVLPIDDDLVSRPGPRVIDGIEAVARLLHPELFP